MQPLIDFPVELDPETQAVVDEVCAALEWFSAEVSGSHEPAQAQRFGRKWWIAFRNSADPDCRSKIIDCCDAIVRADEDLIRTSQGHIFTGEQFAQYDGRLSYVVDSQTGEYRQLIEWPTGTYAGGAPSYERPDGRAA